MCNFRVFIIFLIGFSYSFISSFAMNFEQEINFGQRFVIAKESFFLHYFLSEDLNEVQKLISPDLIKSCWAALFLKFELKSIGMYGNFLKEPFDLKFLHFKQIRTKFEQEYFRSKGPVFKLDDSSVNVFDNELIKYLLRIDIGKISYLRFFAKYFDSQNFFLFANFVESQINSELKGKPDFFFSPNPSPRRIICLEQLPKYLSH